MRVRKGCFAHATDKGKSSNEILVDRDFTNDTRLVLMGVFESGGYWSLTLRRPRRGSGRYLTTNGEPVLADYIASVNIVDGQSYGGLLVFANPPDDATLPPKCSTSDFI